jgi:hypothetical protein
MSKKQKLTPAGKAFAAVWDQAYVLVSISEQINALNCLINNMCEKHAEESKLADQRDDLIAVLIEQARDLVQLDNEFVRLHEINNPDGIENPEDAKSKFVEFTGTKH